MLTQDLNHLDYFELTRAAKRLDTTGLARSLRVAILSDAATQQLIPLLSVLFARAEVRAEFYVAEFDAIELEIYNPASGLYNFRPDVIALLHSPNALRLKYYRHEGDRASFADAMARHLADLWDTVRSRSTATIVQSNFPLPYERPFGNFDQKVAGSPTSVVSALNTRLAALARERPHVLVHDVEALASYVGRRTWIDERLWMMAKALCALEHMPLLAQSLVDIALTTQGRAVKCVVVDLDNTLWGGVIGDDGLQGIQIGPFGDGEPFYRLQLFLRELKRRGVILAVCSKNEEAAALQPFREHADMVLREADFAVFMANWNTKVDNLQAIRDVLNIGFDSIAFLDDNPFERNIVRQYLPEVVVPELPEEPADYVRCLSELNLFETNTFTEEDRQRAGLYREESARKVLEQRFTDVGEYLRSLEMCITLARFDPFHVPRIAQLIQRSNQFNLTTQRYSVAECEAMMGDDRCEPLYLRLSDRFGDSGLISVIVLRYEPDVLAIDSWLMSCRVLARGVEDYAMNHVVQVARQRGYPEIKGVYLPTAKNAMVMNFYAQFGFRKVDERPDGAATWVLRVDAYQARPTYLHPVEAVTS